MEDQEQSTPQQEMGGEAEPNKDREQETAEDTGADNAVEEEQGEQPSFG